MEKVREEVAQGTFPAARMRTTRNSEVHVTHSEREREREREKAGT